MRIKRALAFILCTVIFLQSGFAVITSLSSPGMDFYDSNAVFTEYITLGDVTLKQTQNIRDNGDGTYTLTLSLRSALGTSDQNVDSREPKNNYFTVTQSGEYLIELWGGDGAVGQDTYYSNGGQGGSGGHVYGIVYLDAGSTLYYTLGGNGSQTINSDSGGGANGSGGNHGEIGSYSVGGGGGYSAVYLFASGEFEGKYTDNDGNLVADISESDRISRYILIAGGGGGGGAGNGFSIGNSATGTPDGGAGGSVGGNYGVISGTGYDVEGTYFAGENGKSSGASVNYVGIGATNLPGAVSDTLTTLFDVETPNDWKGTYNDNTDGGAGGAGNMRGGSGGAGFCGGSGGIMTGMLIPTNVGGGGGGSSFISNDVNYTALSAEEESLLISNNPCTTGGAVNISFLGEQNPADNSFSFNGTISRYFDIEDITTSSGAASFEAGTFTVADASMSMSAGAETGSLTVSLVLRPKQGFAGGNNVPILEGNRVFCESGSDFVEIVLDEKCSAVNVPLSFTVTAHSHVTNISGQTYSVSQLYTDNYSDVRDSPDIYWQYYFIDFIGTYTVTDSNGAVLHADDTITAKETSAYTVFFTVVPKSGDTAEVGEPVSTQVFSKTATITVFSANSGELNGNRLSYTKGLAYDEQTDIYELSLQIKAGTDNNYSSVNPIRGVYGTEYDNWTAAVPESGYYMFQLWGGNGGKGNGENGGNGGAAGYVSGYVYLNADEIITVKIGANGVDAVSNRAGGTGGGYTSVQIGGEYIMIAGGGGGGGGYGGWTGWVSHGENGSNVTDTRTEFSGDLLVYSGGSGGTGSSTIFGDGGTGGTAGVNYLSGSVLTDSSLLSPEAQEIFNSALQNDYENNGGGGAFYVTPLQLDNTHDSVMENVEEVLSGYSVDVDISEYFTIQEVNVQNSSDGTACAFTNIINGQHVSVSDINPYIIIEEIILDDGSVDVHGGVDFTVRLRLSVREGFLGGNDVPVLSYQNTDNETGMKISQKDQTLSVNRQGANNPNDPNKSDFANVAIRYTVDMSKLTVNDVNYVRGEPGIMHSELYSYDNTAAYTWEDDFVTFHDPDMVDTIYTPAATTIVPVELGISPQTVTPVKASVGTVAVKETHAKNAVIYVLFQVIYDLANLHTADTPDEDGRYLTEPGQEYVSSLIADKGTLLPAQITVEIGGRTLPADEYAYDPKTGDFLIPASQVTDNITITARSDPMELYTIHYVYETAPGGTAILQEEQEYEVNTQIYGKFSEYYEPAEYNGYTFVWDWGADEGVMTMPPRDIWVFGSYQAIEYLLTIEYVDENGNKIFDDYSAILPYGSEFSVESPVKSGYFADWPIVTGSIEGDTVVRVKYTPTANQLNIVYIYKDSNTVYGTYHEVYATDAAYSVPSPLIPGYTADTQIVSGTMTAQGITVNVYYTPNTYTVTFDAQGGNCTVKERTVVYGNIYGFDGTGYSGLPTPVRVGYQFDGWYLGDTRITEETPVTQLEDHVLTARWKGTEYRLTVRYIYENGLIAADEYTLNVSYGNEYSVLSPSIPGYTADRPIVSGTMQAQNTIVTVTYFKNSYMLTIRYMYQDGREACPAYTEEISRESVYDIPSPEVIGHTPDQARVQGMGLSEDTEIFVTYIPNSYTLTIRYLTEDGTKIFDDYVGSFVFGSSYSVNSPAYGTYVPSLPVVSGTMGAVDQEITVTYYPGEVPEIISVNIEWGELTFGARYDDWNPATHQYDSASIDPTTAGANYVKTTNLSTVKVNVSIAADIDDMYNPYFESFFTAQDSKSDPALTGTDFSLETGGPGNNKTVWLWLEESVHGALASSGLEGGVKVGSCTITISKAGE